MIRNFLWAGLCLIASATAQTQSGHIFRYVNLGTSGTIVLAAPANPKLLELTPPFVGGRYNLREGSFSGAKSIAVVLTSDKLVEAIYFEYPLGTAYASKVQFYVKNIGVPSTQSDSKTVWSDTDTVFEVEQSGSVVKATLFDRKLARK